MKNKYLIVLFIAITAIGLLFTGCKKDEEEEVGLTTGTGSSYIGDAVIIGMVYINSDQEENPDNDEPAADVNIRVLYNNGKLAVVSDSGDTRMISKTVKTDGSGKFEVIVPTTNDGVEFTIEADQYKSSYKYKDMSDLDNDGKPKTKSKEGVFAKQTTKVTLKIGEKRYVEFNYGKNPEIVLTK